MTYSCFITTTYLKANSPIISYVEDDELHPFIKISQDTSIQKCIGTNLFVDIQSKVAAASLNGDERILMDQYIKPATVWCTVYEWTLYNHYKFTNKGITKQNSTDSTSSDLGEVNFVRDDIRNKAEYFKDRLYKYLIANQPLFPLFYGGVIDASTIQPTYNNYYSGIYTGKSRRGCKNCPGEVNGNTWIDLRKGY